MDKSIIRRILNLNKDFYQLQGASFSESRQNEWKGWDFVLDKITNIRKDNIKVLDLGSGNGRFYGYLKKYLKKNFEYLGIDQSNTLMKIAQKKYGKNNNFKQQKEDIITGLSKIKGSYNVVVAFGLTHHIPSQTLRREWFSNIGDLVVKNGLLVLTFWILEKPLKQKVVMVDKILSEQGDVFIGWKNIKGAVRYMHRYSELEINDIICLQTKNNLHLKERFYSDRSKKFSNLYLIFKKS